MNTQHKLLLAICGFLMLTSGPLQAGVGDGRIFYGVNANANPQSRVYTLSSNTFGAAAGTVNQATPVVTKALFAPTRNEMLAGYVTSGGALYVYRWNGSAWSNEWTVNVGGNGANGRRFDIAYEQTSGDAVVVYSNNTGTAPELSYRIWNGTSWSAAAGITLATTTGTPLWVKTASLAGSDQIAMIVSDTNSDLTAQVWNGAAWGGEPAAALETTLETVAATGDVDDFDLAFESISGDLLVVWGNSAGNNGTNGVRYATRSAAGTWSGTQTPPTFADDATNLDLASDPYSDFILFASIGNAGQDLQYGAWDGNGWTNNTANADTTSATPAAGSHMVSCGWLNSGSAKRGVIVYADAANTALDWVAFTPGTGFAMQTDWSPSPAIGTENQIDLVMDSLNPDRLMVTFSDGNSDLWAKRLILDAAATFTWSNTEGGAALTTTLTGLAAQAFSFDYERLALLTVGNGVNPANASLCPGGPATLLNSFTLQTNGGSDTVSGLTVTLAAGTSVGLSLIEITSDTGATVYGSASNPASDTVSVSLSTNIVATSAQTQYRLRITPRIHTAMPAPPGAAYAVTGTVTAITSAYVKSYGDTGSATVTIDNLSLSDPTWGVITPGDAQVALNWTNPGGADFNQVIILRNTVPITDTPVEGATYTAPGTIGSSQVIYVGTGTSYLDTGLINYTFYYYKIFARDNCGNYSAGVQTGPHPVQPPGNALITQTPSVAINSCQSVTVSAPYFGDTNGTSTTSFERSTSSAGPWTLVCGSVTGASPRICNDTGVTAGTAYYYRISFTDADGVTGPNPQVLGPYLTPACNPTAVGTATALVSTCRQITVTCPFTGDGNNNGSVLVEYTTTVFPGTVACAAVNGPSPRQCLVTGLNPSTTYSVRITFTDPDGLSGTNPQTIGSLATPPCPADQVAPTITPLAPSVDAILGGTDKAKVQVYDAGGLAASNPVQWSIDGGALSSAVTVNANYSCGASCSVYEITLSGLANGYHFLTVRATDAANNVASMTLPFRTLSSGTAPRGSGTLLRRTTGSQLCLDCHNLTTHNSQYTDTKYGNWALDCLNCHTPHQTRNIHLVRESLITPNSGTATITFQSDDRVTGTNPQNSFLGDYSGAGNAPYTDGICEACHTKTVHHRNSTSGGDHIHGQNQRCVECHPHSKGFKANESTGCIVDPVEYSRCSQCHSTIWSAMNGTIAKTSRHGLGTTVGTNDSCNDSGLTWSNPLNANAAAVRSCVNMCHPDHVHNPVAGTTHSNNAHQDATSSATRGVTRDANGNITAANTAGSPSSTDFDNAATNGGMCLSCHRFAVESGATPAHPALSKTAYNAGAHNYTSFGGYGAWTYTLHDLSTFNRNCIKCHADRGDGRPGELDTPFGAVHFSDYTSLLAGSTNPNGNAGNDFICYNCHGNGTTGTDFSGKDIATQIAKTYNHPANADNVHNTVNEYNNAAFGNTLGGASRHVNCLDCHETHSAKAGLHTAQSNTAGPSLEGAWGAKLSSNPAFWTLPTEANFTKTVIVSGTEPEATLCFKCHSAYYGTLPTSPSGGFQETDVAREFNPNNVGNFAGTWTSGETAGSFHPVLASAGSNLGATSNIKAPWTRTSLMTCSDCHASDTTTDPGGPHGSAAGFLLKGLNTLWNSTLGTGTGGMPTGTFCINCHNQDFTSSRFPDHTRSDHFPGNNAYCMTCHARIPHGTGRPGMLVAGAGAAAAVGGAITSDGTPWRDPAVTTMLYLFSYPSTNTTSWSQSNCGCNGTGH